MIVKRRFLRCSYSRVLYVLFQTAVAADAKVIELADFTASWSDEHTDHIGEVQHDVTKYVTEDIVRDTKAEIARKAYTFPTQFPRTAAYRQLLTEDKCDWDREGEVSLHCFRMKSIAHHVGQDTGCLFDVDGVR